MVYAGELFLVPYTCWKFEIRGHTCASVTESNLIQFASVNIMHETRDPGATKGTQVSKCAFKKKASKCREWWCGDRNRKCKFFFIHYDSFKLKQACFVWMKEHKLSNPSMWHFMPCCIFSSPHYSMNKKVLVASNFSGWPKLRKPVLT